MQRFTERRVGVDDGADVVEPGTHLNDDGEGCGGFENAAPTACRPKMRPLSLRATTRTKPLSASRLMAAAISGEGEHC